MPIIRTYGCAECNHVIEVTLTLEQWDDPDPFCPYCAARPMRQEFKPVAIGGSATAKAHAIAEDIASNDYHVGNMEVARKQGDVNKVSYKDQTKTVPTSTWTAAQETISHAIASGRQMRLQHGSGLDILQENLRTGAQPDLIARSKERSIKVW